MRISKIKDVKTPERGTPGSAGLDFFIPNDFVEQNVPPGSMIRIPAGVRVEVPTGYALVAFNKSGVALKGLQVGACVIDEDYQGELNIHLFNVSNGNVILQPGQKITQFIALPINYVTVEVVDDADLHTTQTTRGAGAFGSTGTN